jgi:hypothetical protein
VADFVAENEGKLGLIVHQPHQLAGDVDVAPGVGEGVLDGRIQNGEAVRVGGNSGMRRDTRADRLHVGGPRTSFGAAELLDQLRMLLRGLCDVALVQPTLRGQRRRSGDECGPGK